MSVDPKESYLLNYPTPEHFRIAKSNGSPELLFKDDSIRKAVQPTVKVDDRVLFKVPKVNKLSTLYRPEPFTVVHKKGTMVTVK